TESVPLIVPLAVGATLTVIVPDWPAPIAIGSVTPLTLNCALETVICVTDSEAVPLFVRVTVCVPVLPTVTFPNVTVAALNCNEAEPGLAVTRPVQPLRKATTGNIATRRRGFQLSSRFEIFVRLLIPALFISPRYISFPPMRSTSSARVRARYALGLLVRG